jgi:hypothetical protein
VHIHRYICSTGERIWTLQQKTARIRKRKTHTENVIKYHKGNWWDHLSILNDSLGAGEALSPKIKVLKPF